MEIILLERFQVAGRGGARYWLRKLQERHEATTLDSPHREYVDGLVSYKLEPTGEGVNYVDEDTFRRVSGELLRRTS